MTIKFNPAKIFPSLFGSFVTVVSSFRAAFCCGVLDLRDRFGKSIFPKIMVNGYKLISFSRRY